MKAHAQSNHGQHEVLKQNVSLEKIKLFDIAIKMKKLGLADSFIVSAMQIAVEFEGVSDLMYLWSNEEDSQEKDEIIADIQDMIDACSQKEKSEEKYIKFNDLNAIAKNIRVFKDSLYSIIMERGGVSKLSELTSIPQPSLSRFLNSNSMPRRSTVLKIAKALGLDEIKIDSLWNK